MSAKEAVLQFIEAANALRGYEPMELGYALVDYMGEAPIATSYAVYGVTELYRKHVCDRLPEGAE